MMGSNAYTIDNFSCLPDYFLKFQTSSKTCFLITKKFPGWQKAIDSGHIKPITVSYSEDEKLNFIKEYNSLIAALSQENNGLLWWATDLSSRNTYTCLVPESFQRFKDILHIVHNTSQHLIILLDDKTYLIQDVVVEALENQGYKINSQNHSSFLGNSYRRVKRIGGFFYFGIKFAIRIIETKIKVSNLIKQRLKEKTPYYVIKTFAYNSSWDKGKYKDSFFGRLPEFLAAKENILILANVLGDFNLFFKNIVKEQQLIVPLEYFLSFQDILQAIGKILTYKPKVQGKLLFAGYEVSEVFRKELYRRYNGIQLYQLLHYFAIQRLSQQYQIKTFLMTYENNPWEKMCTLALRKNAPKAIIGGYQHSVVPQAALNMFIHPLENGIIPLPDEIFTVGDVSKHILLTYGDYSQKPIKSSCALRYEYLFQIKPKKYHPQGRILLVLDGVSQTVQMLQFVLNQLGGNNAYKLTIRTHPALSWEKLSRSCDFRMNYSNVVISRNSLVEDLSHSDIVIYWQSAVVLEALSMGIPVINFQAEEILSYDPLFLSNALKYIVRRNDSLLKILRNIEQLENHTYQHQLKEAESFINRYFHPVTTENLQLFKF